VEHIVRNAVGPLLAGKTPRQAARPKILDPACGDGSFLTGVYQFLLDWHRDRYLRDAPERWARGRTPRLCREPDGHWRLTTAERRQILLSSVFGVDVDSRAVEAAKLALVLQMLDGSDESARGTDCQSVPQGTDGLASGPTSRCASRGFAPPERIAAQTLARLADNIRCGDALIGPDAVPRITGASADGGFDAVLGNPPYRRERGSKVLLESLAHTDFGRKYRSARMDLWYYFFHRGMELLRPGGVLSFIVSAYWTSGAGAEKLMTALRDDAHLDEVFLLDDLPVFPGVVGRHSIIRVTKGASLWPTTIRRVPPGPTASAMDILSGRRPLIEFEKTADQLFRAGRVDLEAPADELLAKIGRWPPLGDLGIVRQGIAENPAAINAKTNAAFGNRWRVGEGVFALRPAELEGLGLSPEEQALLRPYYDPCDVTRYGIADRPSLQIIYSTKDTCPDIARFPRLQTHLERFRPAMEARRETRKGTNRWWHLHWPREERVWQSPKILSLQFARRPVFVPVREPAYVPFSINVVVPLETTAESLEYLCGLLNCRLLWKWFQHHAKRRGVGLEINGRVLARTPIRRIDFSRAGERERHDQIADLVRGMLIVTQQERAARRDWRKADLCERLEALDRRLDRLIYDLYGLTEEEIAQVEGSTSPGLCKRPC
jgi:adenine-specific DNA-methyltransferase